MKIIEKIIDGDQASLEKIVTDNYECVYRYLYFKLHDETLAKDYTQETFYRFFRSIHEYQDQGKLLNYLYRIARNILYDDYKKVKVDTEEYIENNIPDKINSYDELMKHETLFILRKWMDQLPEHLQDVIILRFDEEMKFKDISDILGIHVSTIKSQLKLALRLLKEKAQEEGWK